MNTIIPALIGGAAMLVISSIYKLIETSVRRRVTVRSPEAQAIAKIVPAVNALLSIQAPQSEALIALLEAQKGLINGNVENALVNMRKANVKFDRFLEDSAMVKVS
jgi:hypothetical protein